MLRHNSLALYMSNLEMGKNVGEMRDNVGRYITLKKLANFQFLSRQAPKKKKKKEILQWASGRVSG